MEKEFYISKEQFSALKEAWNQKQHHSAAEMIIYNILRSKPADNGFVPKTKNIQGNDGWYGFNLAQRGAARFCAPRRNYVRDLPNPKAGRMVDDNDSTLKQFKERFGIDMPTDLLPKISQVRK